MVKGDQGQMKLELETALLAIVAFLFLSVNFSPQIVGVIYVLMAITYAWAVSERRVDDYPISISRIDLGPFLIAVGIAIVAWYAATVFTFSVMQPVSSVDTFSVVGALAAGTTPSYIHESPWAVLFVYGILVPVVETLFFFGVVMPYLARRIGNRGIALVMTLIVLSSMFSLFHIVAHYAQDFALIADWLFAMVSGLIVYKYKDLKGAMFFHIVANSIIMASKLGLLAALAI